MKKILSLVLALSMLLVGCAQGADASVEENYITGVWITYSELDQMLSRDFKSEFESAVKNCAERGITDLFVHTIPFCDAYYKSKKFPLRSTAATKDFDPLEYMVQSCHKHNVKIHAWINPYRVRTADSSIAALPASSPAKIWLVDEDAANDTNVSLVNGIYLNPASSDVRALIIDGVREIISQYDVDGIHFDDYFYPTTDETFDKLSYDAYRNSTQNPIPLDDFRRANVNALISGVYTAIKFKNKDIIFSVSPSASVTRNYNEQYADVAAWCDSRCVDYIIPQLYFGFDYPDENYRFEKLLNDWETVVQNTDTRLIIGLAAYKIGTSSEPDRTEWANGKEVITRQAEICRSSSQISGHAYFSYSHLIDKI